MRDQITITQSLNTVDLFKASVLAAMSNRRIKTIFYLIFSIIAVTSLISVALGNENERWTGILTMVGSILFVAGIFCVLFFVLSFVMLIVKPNLYKNVSYTFNTWGMIKTGKDLHFTRQWEKFEKWRETASFILLHISDVDAHVILKRSISKEELTELREIIERHLGLFPSKK